MVKMALKMLYIERKKAISLFLSITAMLCVSVVFIQFSYNPYIAKEVTFFDIIFFGESYAIAILGTSLMFVCISLMSYSCHYFLKVHSRELGLLKLSGYYDLQVVFYQTIQIIAIMFIASLVAIILSIIILPCFLYIVYQYCHIDQSCFDFSMNLGMLFGIIIPIMLGVIVFIQCRYIIGTSITDLLKQNHMTEYKKDIRILKLPDFIYLLAYILGLYFMYISEEFSASFAIASCIGVFGAYGIFYYWIPHTIEEILQDIKLKATYYVVLGNLSLLMQQSKTLIAFIMLSVIMFPTFILASTERILLHISLHVGAILVNFLLSASLINRFGIDAFEKKGHYQNLLKIGLTKKEVLRISTSESHLFYVILWFFSGIYIISIFVIFSLQSLVSPFLMFIVFLEYVIPYILSYFIVYMNKRRYFK